MKCYNCQTELIWGGDHDDEDNEEHAIVTNLSCPNCGAFHLVYWGHKDKQEDDPEMWKHFCEVEGTEMEIGKGEACSWCGEEEYESRT